MNGSNKLPHITKNTSSLPPVEERVLSDRGISYLRDVRKISEETAKRFGVFSCTTNFWSKKTNEWLNGEEGIVFPNSKYTGNIRISKTDVKGFYKYTLIKDEKEVHHIPYGVTEFILDYESGSPKEEQPKWIFLTESEIDGLSILENDFSYPTLATGGVCGLNRYFQILKVKEVGLPPFVVGCFDRDGAGEECYNRLVKMLEVNHHKGEVVNFWEFVRKEDIKDIQVKDLNDLWVQKPQLFTETLSKIKSYKGRKVLRDELNQFTPVTITSIDRSEITEPNHQGAVVDVHPTFDGKEEDIFSSFAISTPTSEESKGSEEKDEQPQPLVVDGSEDVTSVEVEEVELTNTDIQNLTEGGRRYLEFKKKYGGKTLIQRMRFLQQHPRPVLSTPFKTLNIEMNGGFRTGLHFIGGSTGIGKTSFLLRLCEHFIRAGRNVLYYTFEVEREQIGARMVSHLSFDKYGCEGFTNSEVLELKRTNPVTGDDVPLSEEEFRKMDVVFSEYEKDYSEHIDVIDVSTFEVSETPTITYIYNQVRDVWEQTKEPPIVFIDYLQLIQPESSVMNSSDKQIVDISVRKLKQLSVLTGGYIFAVTSLNRGGYDETPSEKSSKESGLIEYMGDTLTILSFVDGSGRKLTTEEVIDLKYREEKDLYLHLLKNRNGKGRVILTLHNQSKYGNFEDGGRWIKGGVHTQPPTPTTSTTNTTTPNVFSVEAEREERRKERKKKMSGTYNSHYSG